MAPSRFRLETTVLAAQCRVRIPPGRVWLANTLPGNVAPDAHVPRPVPTRLHIYEPFGDVGALQNADAVCGAGELACCPLDSLISYNRGNTTADAGNRDCQQEETSGPLVSGPEPHRVLHRLAAPREHVNVRSEVRRRTIVSKSVRRRALPNKGCSTQCGVGRHVGVTPALFRRPISRGCGVPGQLG